MKYPAMLLLAALSFSPQQTGSYDLLVSDCRIVDGSGNPWYRGDIAIKDGRIQRIQRDLHVNAARVIDAGGMVASPGFIDMHTHSEYTLLRDGNAESKIRQGVTLEVAGETATIAPRRPDMDDSDLTQAGIKERWATFREYFDVVNKKGISVNLMCYVAAAQLRKMVLGDDFRKPTAGELDRMKDLARAAMEDGALGLVSILEAPEGEEPGAVPDTQELIEISKAVAPFGGMYATHLRNQTDHFLESIQEAALIGRTAGIPAEIFHLKSAGKPNFGNMERGLQEIEKQRLAGLDFGADIYPYIAASHGLATEVPRWAQEGGAARFIERLKDPALRARLRKETDAYIETKYYNEEKKVGGYDAVMIASTRKQNDPDVGKTIAEIAKERGISGADAVFQLLVENNANVGIVMFYMSESDMRKGLAHPWVSVCSDASAMSPAFGGKPHPRTYGTFPRILGKYVREVKLLRLEDAVRKMTSLPAARLGLRDRGTLREGNWADVVIFDPDKIIDRATFENPHQYPLGVEYVLVNGTVVIDKGQHTGARPGRVLYGPGRKG